MVSFNFDTKHLAEQYDAVSYRQLRFGKELLSTMGLKPGDRLLDVGCGTGLLGAHAAEIVGSQGKVYGVDPLPLRIDIAATKHPNFIASVGRAEDLSKFAADSVDKVCFSSVFHWIEDKRSALNEARRVLRPGGTLGICTLAKGYPRTFDDVRLRAIEAVGLGNSFAKNIGSPYRISKEEGDELFQDSGFDIVHSKIDCLVEYIEPMIGVITASSRASSFGNFMADIPDDQQDEVISAMSAELQKLVTPEGLRVEVNTLFLIGQKRSG